MKTPLLYLAITICLIVTLPLNAQEVVPQFEITNCPFEMKGEFEGVECGELVVWENRDRPEGGTLRLAVAILRSTCEEPKPDPLVFISGGPGGASVVHTASRVTSSFWKPMRESRDLIFYDQRGTGYSEPEFCEELDQVFGETEFLDMDAEIGLRRRVEAIRKCRETMLAKGVVLSRYNSETSAQDLHDLRQALGYEQWNLLGVSYGTRLSLTAMRKTPSGIRSAILDSVLPPNARVWVDQPGNFANSLQRVFEQCEGEEACRQAYPNLETDFYALLESLDQKPVELSMEDTTRFPSGRIVIDGTLAAAGIFQGLYDHRFIPVVPLLLKQADQGSTHVWRALADQLVRDPETQSKGLNLSVHCFETAPFNPLEMIESAQASHPRLLTPFQLGRHAECGAWHDARADGAFFQPVRSDIPTLLLGGEFDPITPPKYGRLAAETLPNSTFIEVPAAGHAVSPHSECTRNVLSEFLEDPSHSPDTSCVADLPRLSFVTDVHANRGVYTLARTIGQGPSFAILVGGGFLGLILVSGLVGWPLGAAIRRLRGRGATTASRKEKGSRWLAALAALLVLTFTTGIVLAIRETASVNPLLLVFGVSGGYKWAFYLPWIVAVLAVGVVIAAARCWKEGWWNAMHRIHYSLIAAVCIAFPVWVAVTGLI